MSDPNREEFKGTAWHKKDNGLFVPETYSLDEKAEVTKKTLREQVKWVLDNISLVLLLPSFLGALWQILELSSINVAYIRFFSVTQIPVDGILILFLIVLIIVMGKAVIGLLKSAFENKVKGLEDEEFVKKLRKNLNFHIKKMLIVIPIMLVLIIYLISELFAGMFPTSPIVTILLVSFFISGFMFYVLDAVMLIGLKYAQDGINSDNIKDRMGTLVDKYRKPIYWSILAGIAIAIFICYLLIKAFSASFILPADLYNTKTLEAVIYNDFKTKNYEIEYFNDKYIFVKLCAIKECNHRLDKEIIIYPTEKVLFKTTYGKVWTGYFTTYKPVNSPDTP
ncbi:MULTISPECIES: hypothetical protein [Psychrobacter]|jgi:hypothetical protein|uniref:Uncharacterized protein n=1 Tax=Psychrobacter cryohalolentis (strain ATCC BAA-1226 / DSM 17306 / VKM B-2378 / K5) TaxID=335284 RepID=Q1QB18_PSYCK|nr:MULTISPECIES: hypothetical protein [Psychrobacter]ABE75135.1 hypothetical protein Pcryo_1354 [Psychrobacter cryohalolentis K5]AGP48945.1 hypothetical protein PSYCG_07125 [Psychrobacter sp. G]ASE25336.1 hypothetical protein CEP87_01625 [Psychrobacter cryohalolentis]NRD71298.1 hypothetical protein [Psychrobacter okhotskensis]|tara:strand:- start:217 stop:1227 length:1011 start_codon:yes stop_codon:yes gene_type:complete